MAVIPNPKVREDLPMVEERVQYIKSELDSRDLNAEVRFVFRRDNSTVHVVTDISKMPASHISSPKAGHSRGASCCLYSTPSLRETEENMFFFK
jgi:hypothetical protein